MDLSEELIYDRERYHNLFFVLIEKGPHIAETIMLAQFVEHAAPLLLLHQLGRFLLGRFCTFGVWGGLEVAQLVFDQLLDTQEYLANEVVFVGYVH